MRNLRELDSFRDTSPAIKKFYGGIGDETCGAFQVRWPRGQGRVLRIIASSGMGWDHISVSLPDRCPTWDEMEFIKRMFFKPDEVAIQLHLPPADHINNHPYCLHLWRPHATDIPLPPKISV
jgi:hypothetical protein